MDAIHCSKYNITISISIEILVMPGDMGKVFMKCYLHILNIHTHISYTFVGTLAMPGDMGNVFMK